MIRWTTIFLDFHQSKWDKSYSQSNEGEIEVQRIIERGWLKDFYAAFKLYGGIEGFREIIKEVPSLSARDMNFVCVVFDLKKEDLKCYTRKLLRDQHLNS